MRIFDVMDDCIRTGVMAKEPTLPGRLGLRRRAPKLYRRLTRGFYPGLMDATSSSPRIAAGEDDDFERIEGPQTLASKRTTTVGTTMANRRLTRVTGQFDHILQPCPPVGALHSLLAFSYAGNSEKGWDEHECY